MRCLDRADCLAIRDALTGEARDWWAENEERVLELTRSELDAIVAAGRKKFNNEALLPRHVAAEYSRTWFFAHHESWQAWMRSTTDQLRGVARHRAEARVKLWDALNRIGAAVLRAVVEVIAGRLGR